MSSYELEAQTERELRGDLLGIPRSTALISYETIFSNFIAVDLQLSYDFYSIYLVSVFSSNAESFVYQEGGIKASIRKYLSKKTKGLAIGGYFAVVAETWVEEGYFSYYEMELNKKYELELPRNVVCGMSLTFKTIIEDHFVLHINCDPGLDVKSLFNNSFYDWHLQVGIQVGYRFGG